MAHFGDVEVRQGEVGLESMLTKESQDGRVGGALVTQGAERVLQLDKAAKKHHIH
jgi:hypothetical protein